MNTFSDGNSIKDGLTFTMDMGTNRTVRAVRWAHRRFGTDLDRLKNAVLECSDDPEFLSGVTTLLKIPSATATAAYPDYYKIVHEATLSEPVTARYFRYTAANGTYGSIAELELVAADPSFYLDAPEFTYSDLTNFYPVVSAKPYASLSSVFSVVQRASSAAGPFHNVGEWTIGTGAAVWTNTEDAVGLYRYYRLRTVCGASGVEGQVADGPAVLAIRCRRLDRSWNDETTLLSGVAVMPPYTNTVESGTVTSEKLASDMALAAKAFDGNESTFPDLYPPSDIRNPCVGLDFGDAGIHVVGVRFYPRSTLEERMNYTSFYLGNAEDRTDGEIVVPGSQFGFVKNTQEWRYIEVEPLSEARRFIWIYSANGTYWYGNVNEFQVFGWTDEDTRKATYYGTMVILK